jgi:hypothetical protein
MSLPDYNFLSAPLWLITILHVVTLTLHLTAMNFLFGGLIVLVFGRMDDKWQDPTVKTFVKLLPTAMAATVTLGVAPLLFLQLVYYQQAYSAAIVSAWPWLMIVVAVIFAYYFLYGASFGAKGETGRVPAYLALAFVLLAYVSFVYSTVFSMAERPDLYRMLYAADQSGLVLNSDAGSWLLRWLHAVAGAVAVGGFFVGLIGRNNEPAFKLGRSFFLGGVIAASFVGMGYLLTLGSHIAPFMRSAAIWILTVSVVLMLGSVHFFFKKKFLATGALLFLSLLGMVSTRHLLRLIVLEGEFDPSSIPVVPQWTVFAAFLVCFAAAIGAVAYMLKLFFSERRHSASPGSGEK